MKGVVFVALFAFVALQLCHAAPVPEEEKKEESSPPPAHAETSSVAADVALEVKSESSPPEASSAAPAEVTVKVEEKKT